MVTRREFMGYVAGGALVNLREPGAALGHGEAGEPGLTLRPYEWEGPYAEFRNQGARHDWRLCAELRAPWMSPEERLILRTSEIVGYEQAYLYDDHFPPYQPEGRGKGYRHIPFEWRETSGDEELSADCPVPGHGRFWLDLSARSDYLDIRLGIRNGLGRPMGKVDWHFCVVGLESRFSDSDRKRTYLFDEGRLRTFNELSGGPKIELFNVHGAGGFIPVGHEMLPVSPAIAEAPLVIVQSSDRRHVAALAFERAYTIYGDPVGNKCFHADPYFGPLTTAGEERRIKGRLYVMRGTPQDALDRYRRDFQSGAA